MCVLSHASFESVSTDSLGAVPSPSASSSIVITSCRCCKALRREVDGACAGLGRGIGAVFVISSSLSIIPCHSSTWLAPLSTESTSFLFSVPMLLSATLASAPLGHLRYLIISFFCILFDSRRASRCVAVPLPCQACACSPGLPLLSLTLP